MMSSQRGSRLVHNVRVGYRVVIPAAVDAPAVAPIRKVHMIKEVVFSRVVVSPGYAASAPATQATFIPKLL